MNPEDLTSAMELSYTNFSKLAEKDYLGDFIVVGIDETGQNMVQVYGAEVHEPDNRNQRLERAGNVVTTVIASPKVKIGTSRVFYNAMLGLAARGIYVVGNGTQTNAVFSSLCIGGDPCCALANWTYKPDLLGTSQITGVCEVSCRKCWFSLTTLRKSPWDTSCQKVHYVYKTIPKGFGMFISTYTGNGITPQPHSGVPCIVPLGGDIGNVASAYWLARQGAHRVAQAVKFISTNCDETVVINNQYEKVG